MRAFVLVWACKMHHKKFGTRLEISRELFDDPGVDLLGYLARAAAESVGAFAKSYGCEPACDFDIWGEVAP